MCWGLLKPVNAALNCNEPFVLTSGQDENVGKLLQSQLNLRDALIHAAKFGSDAVVGASTRDDEAQRREHVTVVYRWIEQGLALLAAVVAHLVRPVLN